MATNCYNTCFAMEKQGEYFLTDAGGGNGILTQLNKNHIPYNSIHHVFVTHSHTDHVIGMVWMIRIIGSQMDAGVFTGDFHIYCHKELVDTIKSLVMLTVQKKLYRFFDERIIFHVVQDGETLQIMGDEFTFFDIRSTKQKQFGYSIKMDNGVKMTFTGDEPYQDFLTDYLKDSDWLFHEAFCLFEQRDIFKPYEKYHSTVKEPCELAEAMNIPNLVLWHTEDKNLEHRQKRYLAEGKQYYHGNLFVPNDNDVIYFDF